MRTREVVNLLVYIAIHARALILNFAHSLRARAS